MRFSFMEKVLFFSFAIQICSFVFNLQREIEVYMFSLLAERTKNFCKKKERKKILILWKNIAFWYRVFIYMLVIKTRYFKEKGFVKERRIIKRFAFFFDWRILWKFVNYEIRKFFKVYFDFGTFLYRESGSWNWSLWSADFIENSYWLLKEFQGFFLWKFVKCANQKKIPMFMIGKFNRNLLMLT